MERFAADMISNLYGNPHSASASSLSSTKRIEDTRLRVLRFFNASPEDFDVVFVANATAGIKLVLDAFRASDNGFIYGYHKDAHTSLVGVRECATRSRCFKDEDVEDWLSRSSPFLAGTDEDSIGLFAYPAQSNMDGRRLPLSWPDRIRLNTSKQHIYTLLDAAAYVSTSQLDLSDASTAPDFTVLSFYKVFGFPDLGALIVRKGSGNILRTRRYFGGGTVEMVVTLKEQWHAPKDQELHESLEDGTLAIHSIIALDTAISVHKELYGTMDRIAKHTAMLADKLYQGLSDLRHTNDARVCELYTMSSALANGEIQGPVVAFNVRNSYGAWISNAEFERLAGIRRIHIRTGGLCNPGGIASSLGLEPWEMKRNFSAGFRCGTDNDVMSGKPTGVIRASLGAMSSAEDVDNFLSFVREFYVEKVSPVILPLTAPSKSVTEELVVDSLTIYPIKSCGGMNISPGTKWEVRKEGLAWDREWCLVHQGTGQALSQKRYPQMALFRPRIDLEAGLLRIRAPNSSKVNAAEEVAVALSANPSYYEPIDELRSLSSRVCGDVITAHTYSDKTVNEFFSRVLNVPCALARFPAGGSGPSTRHSKAHMQRHQRPKKGQASTECIPGAFPGVPTPPDSDEETAIHPILLSNESPILAISKASLNALNREIAKTGGKAATASVFRANVVLAPTNKSPPQPYSEDHWSTLRIAQQEFKMLGSCRRCHMVCVDQDTAMKDEEPFVTLAKTRRFEGKVFFGSHMCHVPAKVPTKEQQYPTIQVGDRAVVEAGV